MALLQGGYKIQFAGEYVFASDPTAGAVGLINLGVPIPKFSWLTGFWAVGLVAVTGGAGATISFGLITTDLAVPVSAPAALMAATAIAAFVAQPLRGVDLDAAPVRTLNTSDVTMSIAVAALTGGRILFGGTFLQYIK